MISYEVCPFRCTAYSSVRSEYLKRFNHENELSPEEFFYQRICGICSGQSGTGTGFSPNSSVLPCQYHSTVASCSYITWGLTIGLLVTAVKRRGLTPSTWTTRSLYSNRPYLQLSNEGLFIHWKFLRTFPHQSALHWKIPLTLWSRSLSKCYLRIQSVPQREHHTSPLQRSTG
jgi:hypothetical protein